MRGRPIFSAVAFAILLAACSDTPTTPAVVPPRAVASTALSVSIEGPYEATTGYNTWNALASGGDGTYSYQWQFRPRDEVHLQNANPWYNVGTNSSSYDGYVVAEANSFELRVIVTSEGVSVTSDTYYVYHERACQSWC